MKLLTHLPFIAAPFLYSAYLSHAAILVGPTDFMLIASSFDNPPAPAAGLPINIADGITNIDENDNGIAGDTPMSFTLQFPSLVTISGFGAFGQVRNQPLEAFKNFSIVFYDATGTEVGSFAAAGTKVANNWEDWSTGLIENVSTAVLTIADGHDPARQNFAEISEVRFHTPDPVPEPSTSLLVASAGVFAVQRRRRL